MSIETISKTILQQAVSLRASDIHFIPKSDHGLVQFRLDERIAEVEKIPYPEFERLIGHYKFIAKMDIGENRKPQNGSMEVALDNLLIHLRLSSIPSAYRESLVIRLMMQQESHSSSLLSLFPHQITLLKKHMRRASGLILLTGPTGSGKTTMLYSLLHNIQNEFKRQIVTLEDPVERRMDTILQMEVNEKAGVTYGEGFKSMLRHDPDILMIGEIRDEETAKLVVRASLTGHLVLSTLHASDSIGALKRLREFGLSESELSQTLLAIVSQRLVSLTCPHCSGNCHPLCFKRRQLRRSGLFEILSGYELEKCWNAVIENKRLSRTAYRRLSFYFQHALAFGFIPPESYLYWMGEGE